MPVRKKILLLLALAVLIRILAFIVFRSTFDFVLTGQIHGSHAYDTYAVNLLQTGVFGALPGIPDASIPPLYAYILAGVYGLFGRGAPQVVLLNVIVDLVSIVLLVDIGRRLFPDGQAVGLVAGLAAALYPYLIFQSLTLIDSPLFAALLTAFIWAMVVLRQRQDNSASTLALAGFGGLLLGLATLTRPVLAAFVVLLPLWFLFRRTPRETAVRLAPVALLAIVVIGVWTARNARVYERFMPMTATAGSNFWQGNSPLVVPLLRAGYDVQWTSPESLEASDPRSAEADEERVRRVGVGDAQQRLGHAHERHALARGKSVVAQEGLGAEGSRGGRADEPGEARRIALNALSTLRGGLERAQAPHDVGLGDAMILCDCGPHGFGLPCERYPCPEANERGN